MTTRTQFYDGIASYLHGLGLVQYDAVTVNGNVYFDATPQTPDRVVTLTLYFGPESDPVNLWDEPRLQVRTRGSESVSDAGDWSSRLYAALQGLSGLALPGGAWLQDCYGVQSGPETLGADSSGRLEYVVNFQLSVDRSTVPTP